MKYLKYFLILIALLFIFFIAKGLLTPSVSYEEQIIVNKPIEDVWKVITDESKLPKWIKGFKRTEHVSGAKNSIGAVSNVYVEDNGKEMMMVETVTNIEPQKLIEMTFTMDFMDMSYGMYISENNGKTTIKTTSKTVGNGIISKSMVSFMKDAMSAQEKENLNSLKKVIEDN